MTKTAETLLTGWYEANRRKLALAGKIGLTFILFFIICWKRLDVDFGWHLKTGDYIRAHGIPRRDVFTYTASGFPWIAFEWGNDVIVSFLYQLGGFILLSIVFGALWTAALLINAFKTRTTLLLLAVAAVMPYAGIRPTVWTVLSLAILLRLAFSKSPKAKLFIPPLILIWTNLHGGFFLGLGVIAYFAIRERKKAWLYVLLASVAVTFINPYGPRLYVEIYRTLTDPQLHSQVQEWRAFYLKFASWAYVVLWAAGFWMFSKRKPRDWLGLGPLLLLATLSASRNMPLFIVATLKDLDSYFTRFQQRLPKVLDFWQDLARYAFFGALAGTIGLTILNSYEPLAAGREYTYPVQAVAYLQAHPCQGNIFNDYDYGGYLIWKLPGTPVYIDGRMPTWKDSQGRLYTNDYLDVINNQSAQNAQFKQYDIKCVLVKDNESSIINRLTASKWKLAVQGNKSYLFLAPKY